MVVNHDLEDVSRRKPKHVKLSNLVPDGIPTAIGLLRPSSD